MHLLFILLIYFIVTLSPLCSFLLFMLCQVCTHANLVGFALTQNH